jgi:hypothetical protein
VVFVLVILFAPDGIVGMWTRLVWAPLLRRLGARDAAAAATRTTAAASASVVKGISPGLIGEDEAEPAQNAVPAASTQKEG